MPLNFPQNSQTGASRPQRISQNPGLTMYANGGIGYISRRGLSARYMLDLTTAQGISNLATYEPLELLTLLPDIVMEPSYTLWAYVRLANAPDSIRLKAMITTVPTADEIAKDPALANVTPDKNGKYPAREAVDGTAIIDDFFDNLPDEIGGLRGLMSQQIQMTLLTGMNALELVPFAGPTSSGQLWPIHSLTLYERRDKDTGLIALDQKQGFTLGNASNNPNNLVNVGSNTNNFVPLPMERIFWRQMDGLPGNSYGRAPLGAALTEILVGLAILRDIVLAFHRVGTPKTDIEYDFEYWAKLASLLTEINVETKEGKQQVNDWVREQFEESMREYDVLDPDSAYFHAKGTKVNTVSPTWPDVDKIYNIVRWRIVMACKMLPSIFGISEGKTETWASMEYKIFTNGLDSVLMDSLEPVIKALQYLLTNVHGLPYKVECETEPVRILQRLQEAQSEQVEIGNEIIKVEEGWQTNDEAAMRVTGSPAVAEPKDDAALVAAAVDKADKTGASSDDGKEVKAAVSRRLAFHAQVRANTRKYMLDGIDEVKE